MNEYTHMQRTTHIMHAQKEVYLTPSASETVLFIIEPYAQMRIFLDLKGSENLYIHHTLECAQESSVEYVCLVTSACHTLTVDAHLQGAGAHVNISGAYALSNHERVTITSSQRHEAPYTTSALHIKGALAGQAQAHYNGTIYASRTAHVTQASQHNTNLILSDQAQAYSKPQLEVLTNDVRCAHGSAVGHLDEQQILYMRSRGLSELTARKLLVQGFFEDVITQFDHAPVVREHIEHKLFGHVS